MQLCAILHRKLHQNFLRSFGLSSLDELPDLPSASEEEEQLTLDIQNQVERLREQAEASDSEQIGDEELVAAATALAQQEGASEAEKG